MATYEKPFFNECYGTAPSATQYPYSRELFGEYDIFPLFVLDGGAFFFTQKHLGAATGAAIRQAWEDGRLLSQWKNGDGLNWDRVFDDTFEPATRGRIEEHVWLNRLYFLLPLAHGFSRTGEEKWARAWLDHLRDWKAKHPHPGRTDLPALDTKWCWFDMQVTWRFLVLVHSIFLLRQSESMDRETWKEIYGDVRAHLAHVLTDTRASRENRKTTGNHFLQKGVALLYGALLFPEFDEAEESLEEGLTALAIHDRDDIMEDGCSIEACPSYSHFIARLYLEALLLLEGNDRPVPDWLRSTVSRQYAYLGNIQAPGGSTLQISDSYALDVRLDLEIVGKLIPLNVPEDPLGSLLFQPSQLAVLRSADFTVFIDAIKLGFMEHHHAGKPNVLIYYRGKPFVIDSGCPCYDDPERRRWFKTAEAHNTVIVYRKNGQKTPARVKPSMRISRFTTEADRSEAVIVSRVDEAGLRYEWTRSIVLAANTLSITDCIESDEEGTAAVLYHFSPDTKLSLEDGSAQSLRILEPDIDFVITKSGDFGSIRVRKTPAYDNRNQLVDACEVAVRATGKTIAFESTFQAPQRVLEKL